MLLPSINTARTTRTHADQDEDRALGAAQVVGAHLGPRLLHRAMMAPSKSKPEIVGASREYSVPARVAPGDVQGFTGKV